MDARAASASGARQKTLLLPAIEAPGSGQPFAPETHLVAQCVEARISACRPSAILFRLDCLLAPTPTAD